MSASRDETTAIQLRIIREVHKLLDSIQIPHWLGGGWALDFLLGEIASKHGDIDWLIWKKDASAAQATLEENAFRNQKVRHPEEHFGFYKHEQYVSFTLNELNEEGQIVTSGRWRDWPYPDGSFSANPGRIGDIACPIVSAEGQLDSRENFHKHPAGAPLRDVDVPAIERLRGYTAGQKRSEE